MKRKILLLVVCLISVNSAFTQTNVSGNISSYEVVLTPEPDANGIIEVHLSIEDGIDSLNSDLGNLRLLSVNDNKPVLLTESVNAGELEEDHGLTIREDNFYSKINATDEDGDEIKYIISELIRGNIYRNDDELKVGDTLRSSSYNVWYAPPNESGLIDAFKVKASDGKFNSDNDLIVSFNVTPFNDPPTFDTPGAFTFERSSAQKVMEVRNLTAGPLEDENITLTLSPNRAYPFATSNFTVELLDDQKSAKIALDYIPDEQGFYFIDLILSDGTNRVGIRLNMVFYESNNEPVVSKNSLTKVYTGEMYTYNPEVQDAQAFQISSVSVPDFITYDSSLFMANYMGSGINDELDGIRTTAKLSGVQGLAFDDSGNLILAEGKNDKVKKINLDGVMTTIAGNGSSGNNTDMALDFDFNDVRSIAFDKEGNLYATDFRDHLVVKIYPDGRLEKFLGIVERSWHQNGNRLTSGISGPLDIVFDSKGNMYVLNSSLIKKIDTNDIVSEYVTQATPNVNWGTAHRMAINSRDEIIVTDRRGSNLYKIVDGEVSVITLPEPELESHGIDFLTDDIVVFSDFYANKIYMYDLLKEELSVLAGQGNEVFRDGTVASINQVIAPFEVVVRDGLVYFYGAGSNMIKVLYPNYHNFRVKPLVGNIGTHEVSFRVTDIYGLSTEHTDQMEVVETDKVQASNIDQQIVYTEDEMVDLDDIVISDIDSEETVEVSITIVTPAHGTLSVDSGQGEVFDDNTGAWLISGSMAAVNDALSKLHFRPRENLSVDSYLLTSIKREGGVLSNEGSISLKVTAVNDILQLNPEPTETAYTELEYEYVLNIEDPDDYLFGMDIQKLPGWLELNSVVGVTTFSGDPSRSNVRNGVPDEAGFRNPRHVTASPSGAIYVAENNVIRKISLDGVVTSLAGSQYGGDLDGQGAAARFGTITAMVVDADDNVYVYDFHARKIKRINSEGVVESLVGNGNHGEQDGSWLGASFSYFTDMTMDKNGNIYGLSFYDGLIRKISTNGTVETVIGSKATGEHEGDFDQFGPPEELYSLAIDSEENLIIGGRGYVYKADFSTNIVSILTGDGNRISENGPLAEANVTTVYDLIVDKYDNIYITDGSAIKVIKDSQVSTLVGNSSESGYANGEASQARFNEVTGIADTRNGELLIADLNNHTIRKVDLQNIWLTGVPQANDIGNHPLRIQFSEGGNKTYLLDANIEVKHNGMPVINGLDQVFEAVEDDAFINISGISVSEVDADSLEVILILSNALAGSFPSDESAGAVFNNELGKWTIRSTQASINTLFSTLQFSPISDFSGCVDVHVEAKRFNGLFTREGDFSIVINSVNDLPLLNLERIDAMVDLPLDLPLDISDADNDPIGLEVTGLPDWLTVETAVEFELLTLVRLQSAEGEDPIDGHISEATVSYGRSFTVDPKGKYYFADNLSIRVLERDTLKTLINLEDNDFNLYSIWGVFHDGNELYIHDFARIFKIDDSGLTLVAGDPGLRRGDRDGDASTALFTSIKAIASDGQGGLFIADSDNRKVKHLTKDGQVSTVAGNGEQGNAESPDGAALETAFSSLEQLWVNNQGEVFTYEAQANRIRRITNGMVETILPKNDENLPALSHFDMDLLGSFFSFNANEFQVYDGEGKGLKNFNVPIHFRDGSEKQFGWGNLTDIVRTTPHSFIFFDWGSKYFRELSYKYTYRLTGTPPPGSEGTSALTIKLNDGIGERVSFEIPLVVNAPDRPVVNGLPQVLSYVEGDEVLNVNPIIVESEDEEKLFELRFALSNNQLGALNSSVISLEDALILALNMYEVKGNMASLNNVLASLYFEPAMDNDENGQILFFIKNSGGQLAYEGHVDLMVTPVNDTPAIGVLPDITTYVGDSVFYTLPVYDVEDKGDLIINFEGKPSWLRKEFVMAQDELIAGTPGKLGLKFGRGEEAGFARPYYLVRDNQGGFLISNADANTISRLDKEGNVTLFAGEGKVGSLDGAAKSAMFDSPHGMVVDREGNIYIADRNNYVIRKIDTEGIVTTIAGTGQINYRDDVGRDASFIAPNSLVFTNDQKTLFIGDGYRIRKLDMTTMDVSTFLVDHPLDYSGFFMRLIMTKDDRLAVSVRNDVVLFDLTGHALEVYGSPISGSHDGIGTEAGFKNASGIAEDNEGNLYVIDSGNNLIRKIDRSSGMVSTIAGTLSKYKYQSGINENIHMNTWSNLLYEDGALLFPDTQNHVIRKLYLNQTALIGRPSQEDIGKSDIQMVVEDSQNSSITENFKVRVISNDMPKVIGLDTLLLISEANQEAVLPLVEIQEGANDQIIEVRAYLEGGLVATLGSETTALWPFDENEEKWTFEGTVDQVNTQLGMLKLFSDSFEDANLIFEFRKDKGSLSYKGTICLVVEPVNTSPALVSEKYLTAEVGKEFELMLNVEDSDSEVISVTSKDFPDWLQTDSTWVIQPFINVRYSEKLPDFLKDSLRFSVYDFALNSKDELFMTVPTYNMILKLEADGSLISYAGNGTKGFVDGSKEQAQFNVPFGLDFDDEDNLFVADTYNNRIRRIDGQTGEVTTIAGNGVRGAQDGPASVSIMSTPSSLRFDNEGNLIVWVNHQIKGIDKDYNLFTIAGSSESWGDEDGPANSALIYPSGSVLPQDDGSIMIWGLGSFKLKKIADGHVTTVAGDGDRSYLDKTLLNSSFQAVYSAIRLKSGEVMVSDWGNHAIRVLDFKKDTVYTLAGKGYLGNDYGATKNSSLEKPLGIIELSNGEILVGSTSTGRIDRLARHVSKVSGTPMAMHLGEHEFSVRISDGKDGVIEEQIIINVIPANTTPEIIAIDDITETYVPDVTISIPLFDYFSDAEDADENLIYTVSVNSDNSVVTNNDIDSADGILTLNIQNAGITTLEVTAIDTEGASISTSFDVTITQATATVTITDTEFINDGEAKMVTVTTDPEGLSYTATYNSSETAPSAIGAYTVLVTLTDRNYMGSATAEMSIINIAPEDIVLSVQSVFENQEGTIVVGNLSVTDQNSTDTHTYSLPANASDNALFSVTDNTLSATSPFDFETKDVYEITLRVEDNNGGSYEKAISINVLDINDAPGVEMSEPIEIVQDLGPVTFQVSGLNTGGETAQALSLSATVSGSVTSASVEADQGGTTATITFETVSGQQGSGTIELIITDDGGTANGGVDSKTVSIPVTVSAANLTVTEAGSCGPGQVTLSASGADDYRWYSQALGGDALNTGPDFSTSITEETIFFVAGVFSGNESTLRVPVKGILFQLPETPVIVNDVEILSITEVAGASYIWFRNGADIEGATEATFAPVASGNYSMMITNANGCTAMSDALQVIITALEEAPVIEVSIYPVPASEYIYLSFGEVMRKGTRISLQDGSGRELTKFTMKQADDKATIDVHSFASGVHFITIQDGNKRVRKRVMIKR